MNKTAIIYSFNTKKTGKVAEKIIEAFNDDQLSSINAEELTEELFTSYNQIIMGVATWFDGELPNHWDEFVPALEDLDLSGKKIALFGLGDQKGYPENFLDGMGIMAQILVGLGATLVGFTSTQGYEFESSRALRGDMFTGLAIDYENQGSLNKERIANWVEQLKREFS
ncbi:MAG: flavodoxin [Bacteroidetes bacterium]|nr:MAG: flavodoxin [Bacteroidota bacterium]